jgi:hypothetical protein
MKIKFKLKKYHKKESPDYVSHNQGLTRRTGSEDSFVKGLKNYCGFAGLAALSAGAAPVSGKLGICAWLF